MKIARLTDWKTVEVFEFRGENTKVGISVRLDGKVKPFDDDFIYEDDWQEPIWDNDIIVNFPYLHMWGKPSRNDYNKAFEWLNERDYDIAFEHYMVIPYSMKIKIETKDKFMMQEIIDLVKSFILPKHKFVSSAFTDLRDHVYILNFDVDIDSDIHDIEEAIKPFYKTHQWGE